MISSLGIPARSLFVLIVALATCLACPSVSAQRGADPPTDTSQEPAGQVAPVDASAGNSQVWTCSMHPHVRQADSGRCPVCSMHLIVARAPGIRDLPTLQEMLAIALKHNPDVRAADARLRSMEAELDRTRLTVVQKLIAYREKWQAQRLVVQLSREESRGAERRLAMAKGEERIATKARDLLTSANERLAFESTKLAEVEAELPFLLGQAPGAAAPSLDESAEKLIRQDLLPKASQILQVRLREYQTGNTNILALAAAHRQLVELETRLAKTNKQKIAALRNQKALIEQIRDVAAQLYQAAEVAQGDVLTIDLEISKLELWMLELGDQ